MSEKKEVTLEEKIKALATEQQVYINGLIDGALLHTLNNLQPTG